MEDLKLICEDAKSKRDTQAGAEGVAETFTFSNYQSNKPNVPTDSLHISNISHDIININELTSALRIKIGKKNRAKEENIRKLAEYVLNFFGYSDSIIDNVLSTEDRDVFYTLEEEGILSTEREEMYILKGKVWRIHYWMLNKKEIKKLAQADYASKESKNEDYANVYDSLSDEIWKRN